MMTLAKLKRTDYSQGGQHQSDDHAQDFDKYVVPLAKMQNANTFQWGIVHGLSVTGALGGTELQVDVGVGIDGQGRLLALVEGLEGADIGANPWATPVPQHELVAVPLTLSTTQHAGQTLCLTVEYSQYHSGSNTLGDYTEIPWVRLRNPDELDPHNALILATVTIDDDGKITAIAGNKRRTTTTTIGELRLQRSQQIDGTIAEVTAATLAPGAEGGLKITVPAARDTIALATTEGTSFATLAVQAATTHVTGMLEVDGNTNLHGTLTVAKSAILQNGLTVETGDTTLNGDLALKDKMLKLRQVDDPNHGMLWNHSVDGPEFRGNRGFVWKTAEGGDKEQMRLTKDTLTVTVKAVLQNGLTVAAGDTTLQGKLTVTGGSTSLDKLTVAKPATLQDGLTVEKGDTTLQGKLTVTESAILQKGLTVETGDTTLNGDLALQNKMLKLREVSDPNHGMLWNRSVDGPEFRGNRGFVWITAEGSDKEQMRLTKDTLTVAGKVALKNGLTVETGDTSLKGKLTVTNDTTLAGKALLKKGLVVDDNGKSVITIKNGFLCWFDAGSKKWRKLICKQQDPFDNVGTAHWESIDRP